MVRRRDTARVAADGATLMTGTVIFSLFVYLVQLRDGDVPDRKPKTEQEEERGKEEKGDEMGREMQNGRTMRGMSLFPGFR